MKRGIWNCLSSRANASIHSFASSVEDHCRRWVARSGWLLGLVAIGLILSRGTAEAVTVPANFVDTVLVRGLTSPTAMAFSPDNRLFVCEQGGALRVVKNGSLLPTPFVQVPTAIAGERGLVGIAIDPAFAANQFLYLYYTASTPTVHNRISRFTASGDAAVAGSETVLLDLDELGPNTFHEGGALNFGSDGKLYIAVGENGTSSNSQTLANMLGKMLRINSNGTIPTDNPFYNTATGANRSIWALGLRNPFTFAVQPGTGRMFINDVGATAVEEVNEGVAGSNYGWPLCEGAFGAANASFRDPLYQYIHGLGDAFGNCVIGGAFYNPATLQYPSSYTGVYFFGDYVNGWLRTLDPAHGNAVAAFASGVDSPVGIKLSPDGRVHYLTRGDNSVHVITYTNATPQISSQPANLTVVAGLSASFQVTASGATPLAYQWQRNGSDVAGATSATYTLATTSLSDNGASFCCRVTNPYGSVTSSAAVLTVTTNQPPTGVITAPLAGATYQGGTTIFYAGSATDPQDGVLPPSAFSWTIVFHHDTHTHPFLGPITGVTSGSFLIPTVGETSPNVWYRVHLTVTDSFGQSQTSYVDVRPVTNAFTLATVPTGLQVTLDGQLLTTPASITGVVGMIRTLGVITPQTAGGTPYSFMAWTDGGLATHTFATPTLATNYAAVFCPPVASSSPVTFGNPGKITIQDNSAASPYPSTLQVSGMNASAARVSVTLTNLSHTWPQDVGVLVVGPQGQSTLLMSDAGGGTAVANATLTFDDTASAGLTSAAIVSGTYKPSPLNLSEPFPSGVPAGPYGTSLSGFKGISANGVWSLYVVDETARDQGLIAGGWGLTIVPNVNSPPTISPVPDQTVAANGTLGPLSLTIGDLETPATALVVTGSSSNPALMPAANLVFGGSGASRALTLSPAPNQTGTAIITLTVSDGTASASTSFNLTVTASDGGAATVFANAAAIAIQDNAVAAPYPSAIQVSGLSGSASKVTVTLTNFNHTWPHDVGVLLVGPTGQNVVLMADVGGGTRVTNAILTFDDAAASSLGGGAIVSGTYKPSGLTANDIFPTPAPGGPHGTTLSVFNGSAPNGTWSLFVLDDASQDQGSITGGWSLSITTPANNASSTATFDSPGAISILDNSPAAPYPATLQVSGLFGVVGKATVTLTNLSHTWPHDVGVLLVAPTGQDVVLMADVGGGNRVANATLTFDDSASSLLNSGPIVTGTYRPSGLNGNDVFPAPAPASPYGTTLAAINGAAANGTWSLYVLDDASQDQGSIAWGWSLTLTTTANSPPVISAIADQTTLVNAALGPLAFTVGDLETSAADLTVAAASSNASLVPSTAIVLSGSGSSRSVTITPALNQVGTATITLTVGDGQTTANTSFILTVTGDTAGGATFFNPTPITIVDHSSATPFPSSVAVAGITGIVTKVTATLANFSHTWPHDVGVVLAGPTGQNVLLMSDVGGGNPVSNAILTFDDAAAGTLNGGPIVSGTYKPGSANVNDPFPTGAPPSPYGTAFSVFNGINPNGAWSLYVVDDAAQDGGTINGGWSLGISTRPPTALLSTVQPVGSAAALETAVHRNARATPAPVLRGLGWPDEHRVQVTVEGIPGRTYVLQVSSDLIHWQDLGTQTAPSDVFEWACEDDRSIAPRFYRVRLSERVAADH